MSVPQKWNICKNKIKTKKYRNVGTIRKSKMKIFERGKIDTSYTHTRPQTFLAWCRHFMSKNGKDKLVVWAQVSFVSEMMLWLCWQDRILHIKMEHLVLSDWCSIINIARRRRHNEITALNYLNRGCYLVLLFIYLAYLN
jgi:hypothetical protein